MDYKTEKEVLRICLKGPEEGARIYKVKKLNGCITLSIISANALAHNRLLENLIKEGSLDDEQVKRIRQIVSELSD